MTAHPDFPADPIAAVTHHDPYPYYASLRDGPSLVWHAPLRVWIASRAGVIEEILQDHDAFRVRPAGEPVPSAIAGQPAGEVFGHLVRMNDGAVHAAQRPALQRAVACLDLEMLHSEALRVAFRAADLPLADALFAWPVGAVAQALGFVDAQVPQVVQWMRDFVGCLSPLSTATQLADANAAAYSLMRQFETLVAQAPPRNASLLAGVCADPAFAGAPRALLANLIGLMSQTCDATAGLLGNSLIAITLRPEWRELARTRSGLRTVMLAAARHDPAIQNTRRFARRPVEVAGVHLAAGDGVLLLLAAASRDPARAAASGAIAFGHGVHACPGQALACTLATAGLETLLAAAPDLDALRSRGWHYRASVNARIPVFH